MFRLEESKNPLTASKSQTVLSSEKLRHSFDPSRDVTRISDFVHKEVGRAGANGIVVGLSGGIDSSVVASVSVRALGLKRVLGVFMFEEAATKSKDYADALRIARQLELSPLSLPVSPVISDYEKSLKSRKLIVSRITLANIKARSRMVFLYALANERNLLVAGTSDRSELLVGYFTKYGDGAADLEPIIHLYKTEVRALGAELKLPYDIVTKPSTPNLWENQTASEELPADYDVLDRILTLLYDQQKSPKQISEMLNVPIKIVREVVRKNRQTEHKRQLPKAIGI